MARGKATDYHELTFPTGHIGLYVSRRAQATVAPAIATWIQARC